MATHQKEKKAKDKKEMTSKQGAFTKKPWNESSTSEKVKGVGITAAAAGIAGLVIRGAMK